MAEILERGVWGILATPFTADPSVVDLDGFTRQVELHRAAGGRGVVALGVFGEAAKLSDAERRTIVRHVVDVAGDDLGVVIGLSELATVPTVAQAELVADAAGGRLRGLMVQVNTPRAEPLAAHLAAVRAATGLGLVVQDYPVASGITIAPDALCDAVAATDGVVAIKAEASPTPPAVAAIVARTDIPVFGGLGGVNLIDELVAGGAGAMTGFSCPEGLNEAVAAWFDAGFEAVCDAWAPWLPLSVFEAQQGIALAVRKELMRRRGILAHATVRPPGPALPATLDHLLDVHLDRVRDRMVS